VGPQGPNGTAILDVVDPDTPLADFEPNEIIDPSVPLDAGFPRTSGMPRTGIDDKFTIFASGFALSVLAMIISIAKIRKEEMDEMDAA